jgi:glycosyltransferase involved in cell wall biosynthesis
MNILIANPGMIPVFNYGGTERVLWSLGRELNAMGHKITYLVNPGSTCSFARVIYLDPAKPLTELIPDDIDFIHFNFIPDVRIDKPYIVNQQGNTDPAGREPNMIFVSANHAERFGSDSFIHNGLDWSEYAKPDFNVKRNYFHFLANAAWRLKNVKGAIRVTRKAHQRLAVLGGSRLNIKMGFRLTLDLHASFYGMVGGKKKYDLINGSKGLVFPVRWHEPFGLALTESLFYGCPVFGTPYGSLPEIVTKEVGFLSPNSDELAYALKNVDEFDRKKCSEYALDNFNSKKMALEYLERYEKVLNGEKLNRVNPSLQKIQQEKFLPFN